MGQISSRKPVLAVAFAAAAMILLAAPSPSYGVEATESGPRLGGTPPGLSGKGEGAWAKAGSVLRQVAAAHAAHQQGGGSAPFEPPIPAVRYANGSVLVDAVAADGDGAALLGQLERFGLTDGTSFGAVVSGYIPVGRLQQAVELGALRSIAASLKPETNNSIDPTFGFVHDRSAAIAMSLIAAAADPQTYTGAGLKIGVLSDTFDNNGNPDYDGNGLGEPPATNADDDLLNGDLPGGTGYVALHTPGDVDDDDKSAFAAVGTSGATVLVPDTLVSKNRSGSIKFDRLSPDEDPVTTVLSYPDADHYTIGNKPFTLEMWVNFETVYENGIGAALASHYSSNNQRAWFVRVRGPAEPEPNTLQFWASPDGGSANAQLLSWPWTPVQNTWYHVALSRDEQMDMRVFVDGVQIGTPQKLGMSIFDSAEVLRISSYDSSPGNNRPLDGWVEDFRFVVGEALYTADFPQPTVPLSSSLPASAGPTTTVVDDSGQPGIDEGRAMAQLIHDVAPNASISFHTAFNGMADFAQGIQDLADDGADIVVDDIIYFAEPMFQDGIVAQAVDAVVAQGIPYFSSAGNSAQNSYESGFVASGERLSVGPEDRGMLHNFNTGGGPADWRQSVTVPANNTLTVVLQWDQPFASNCPGCPGSANDMDIYLVDDNMQIVAQSITDNLTTGEPVEVLQFQNIFGIFGTSFHIMITHYDDIASPHPVAGDPPDLMKYVWFGQSTITFNEHTTDSAASYGHANAAGAAAVGAAFYGNTPAFGVSPPVRESFSSMGGVPILFDVQGNSLGVPGPREKPEFVAPDGTNTTFFYRDTGLDTDPNPQLIDPSYPYTEFPNFFGTSAAAPHAAAIAALMLEANPALTPGDIYAILEDTAVDMDAPGFDFNTGYGLIDASAALAQATGGNLTPVANDDNGVTTDQNTLVSIPVLANDAPGDAPTAITIEVQASNGTATPNGAYVDYVPNADYFGTDSFQYRITDNDGEFSIATVNVTVNELDIQPLAVNDNAATDEDTVLANIALMANDNPLGNAPTTITAAGPGKAGSMVTIAPDGGSITYEPAPNDFGIDTFPYTITDADGDSSNANVTITINSVNDAPVADNDPTATAEDTPVAFTEAFMLDGDTDIENDPLSVTVVSSTSFAGGTVTNDGGGSYTYTPPANFNGDDAVSYIVSDGADTDTGSVVITVTPVNDPPAFTSDPIVKPNATEGGAYTGQTLAGDASDPEDDALTFAKISGPVWLSVAANGALSGTPGAGDVGLNSFTVSVSDGGAADDTASLEITVDAAGLPLVAPTGVTAVDLGGGFARITWNDSNASETGFLLEREKQAGNGSWKNATILGPISAETFDDDSGKGTFRYRVRAVEGATEGPWSGYSNTVDVTTGGGGGGNAAPTASFTPSCTGLECNFDGSGSTDDGTIVSYDWDFGDGTVVNNAGATPVHVYGVAGTYPVTLTVTDDLGATDQTTQNVTVTDSLGIVLSATGFKQQGVQHADLSWSNANGTDVEIYRDGNLVATTANDGAYTDNINARGGGSYSYQICETGDGAPCSNFAQVTF